MAKTELSPNTKGYPSRARVLCDRIVAGEKLEEICASPGMPELKTVRRWLLDSVDFRRRYARARKLRAERLVDQVVEIADEGDETPSEAAMRRRRLRIDARKWAVAQFANTTIDQEDGDALPPPPRFAD